MKKLAGIVLALALVVAANIATVSPVHAETDSNDIASLMETVKALLAKVADLQKELANVRGEVKETKQEIRETLKDGLKEGMTDEDVKKIQELFASDKAIYPEGMVTGYFGRLTKEAVKRFQAKHNIEVTGELDEETKELIEEYFGERSNGKFPQGIFHAPGIAKKIQDRFCDRKGSSFGGWFCKDWEDNDDEDEDDNCIGPWLTARCHDNDDDEDEDEDEEEFDVTVEIEDGISTVSFTVGSTTHNVEVESLSIGRILTEVADELDTTVRKLDRDLKDEIEDAWKDALKEENDVTEEEAQEAIDDAQEAIDAVQEDIDEADEDVDTDDAQETLDEATEALEDAQEAFDDEDYEEADDHADEAEEKAQEAADELEEAIEDAD